MLLAHFKNMWLLKGIKIFTIIKLGKNAEKLNKCKY